MSRTFLLLSGFAALILLAGLCTTCHRRAIETDLLEAGRATLAESELAWAKIDASGCVLRLADTAPSPPELDRALALLRAVPGVCNAERAAAGDISLAGTQQRLQLDVTMEEGVLRLSGSVPDSDTRRHLVSAAGEAVGAERVVNELAVRSSRPVDGWHETARALIGQFQQLRQGSASLTARKIELEGVVNQASEAEAMRQVLTATVPAGFEARVSLAALNATTPTSDRLCQRLLRQLLEDDSIFFASSSAVVEQRSFVLLDRLALTAGRCPVARIEIAGHTDSEGDDQSNLELSRQRAEAVRRYLLQTGVAPDRITAAGYGETRPIADNATADGRARNRRIEFQLR